MSRGYLSARMSAETSSSSALTTSTSTVLHVPLEWPPEVAELYDPVQELGRGGFASVLLARHKQFQDCHAIKVVGSKIPTRQERECQHKPSIACMFSRDRLIVFSQLTIVAISFYVAWCL